VEQLWPTYLGKRSFKQWLWELRCGYNRPGARRCLLALGDAVNGGVTYARKDSKSRGGVQRGIRAVCAGQRLQ
jgi:hypothetical protein